jgi:hypothetical protein
MKLLKCISLFILYPLTMFAIGFAANKAEMKKAMADGIPRERIMEYFYPGESTDGYEAVIPVPQESEAPIAAEPVAVVDKKIISANTEFVVQKFDTAKGLLEEETKSAPDKYIGMTREDLANEIRTWNQNPPLKDLEQGLQYMELYSFSPKRVVIRKTYTAQEEEEGFFLVNENHCVVVYQKDLQNVYLSTDIKVDELPGTLRDEILHIKYVENEKELYNFLESYSS